MLTYLNISFAWRNSLNSGANNFSNVAIGYLQPVRHQVSDTDISLLVSVILRCLSRDTNDKTSINFYHTLLILVFTYVLGWNTLVNTKQRV